MQSGADCSFAIRDIRAHSNLAGLWQAYRGLFFSLVGRNLKIRLGGVRHLNALGLLLIHLNPVVIVAVYIVVCGGILKLSVPNYAVFLAVGHLHWNLFTSVVSRACGSVYRDAGMIQAARFPYILLTLADLADQLLEFLMTLALMFVLLPLLGGQYSWTIVIYPLVLGLQVLFMAGLAAGFSALQGVFADVGKVQALALRLMFWFTPVIYSVTMVPPRFQAAFTYLNPLTLFLESYRELLCYERLPAASHWLAMLVWSGLSLLLGWKLFHRLERHLPEAF